MKFGVILRLSIFCGVAGCYRLRLWRVPPIEAPLRMCLLHSLVFREAVAVKALEDKLAELEPPALHVVARIDEIRPPQSYAELVAELDAPGLGIELADDLEAITLKLPKGLRFDQVQRERKAHRKGRRRAG